MKVAGGRRLRQVCCGVDVSPDDRATRGADAAHEDRRRHRLGDRRRRWTDDGRLPTVDRRARRRSRRPPARRSRPSPGSAREETGRRDPGVCDWPGVGASGGRGPWPRCPTDLIPRTAGGRSPTNRPAGAVPQQVRRQAGRAQRPARRGLFTRRGDHRQRVGQ